MSQAFKILVGWIRSFFFFIDRGIYFLLKHSYNLVTELSKINILSQSTIKDFADRIYVFIGIFMLFKVGVSLINYFINPDNFGDSKNGAGGLLRRILTSLILVIVVPIVFEFSIELQNIILDNNIIASVFFGDTGNTSHAKTTFSDGGDLIGVELFKAFFRPAYDEYDKSYDTVSKVDDFEDMVNKKTGGDNFMFEYRVPLTTLVGGFAAWVLVMFCFDVGVRAVKFSFLQLIAPVPVLSYMEPKKGEKMFNQWVSECVSTYLSVFIRLAALYFVMYIFAELSNDKWAALKAQGASPLAIIFIILGLLMFLKEAPRLICNILGIKDSGGFTLNPFKKLQQVPGVGWLGAQALGRTAGALESALHDQTGHRIRAAFSGAMQAGDALHGKVPFMGTEGKGPAIRPFYIGRQAGYEAATGRKMAAHRAVNDLFKGQGKDEINKLKSARGQLFEKLSQVQLQKGQAAEDFNKLSTRLNAATTDSERNMIRKEMDTVSARYNEIVASESSINKDIGVLNDQIRDIERAYSIDKSPYSDVKGVLNKIQKTDNSQDGYKTQFNTNASQTPTVSGVPVYQNERGETETASGIILNPTNATFNEARNNARNTNNQSNGNTK